MSAAPALAALRARIAALEGGGGAAPAGVLPLGVAAIDRRLPRGGLTLGGLHDLAGAAGDGAATAFAAMLLGRLAAHCAKPVLWIGADADLYPPGLAGLGLTPARLLLARPLRGDAALWAAEEGLRCRDLAAVLVESGGIAPIAARRLHLAARASGVTALLLGEGERGGVAESRWRVTAAANPGACIESWRWRVTLRCCRGLAAEADGTIASWELEWVDETGGLRLAAPAAGRTAAPGRGRAAG
ncbi:ImuA family protein [Phaeospirillum tilakii]|uniref:ImuA family protein n=1 Tax=Phaeospirillum tilakii TaxID=741673 RepID=A0ABW5C9C3_9PROT